MSEREISKALYLRLGYKLGQLLVLFIETVAARIAYIPRGMHPGD